MVNRPVISKPMKFEDIDNDQKTSLISFFMVLVMWFTKKGWVTLEDATVLESILFLGFGFYTNRRNNASRKDDR